MSSFPDTRHARKMTTPTPRRQTAPATLAILACALALSLAGPAAADGAFEALKGSWSGGGGATFEGGEREKLRCAARYAGDAKNLSLSLKCASASTQIHLSGTLEANGNMVAGGWNESSFGLKGNAFGSIRGSTVRLRISGDASGTLTLNISGGLHSVAFATKTSALRGVSVSLKRR